MSSQADSGFIGIAPFGLCGMSQARYGAISCLTHRTTRGKAYELADVPKHASHVPVCILLVSGNISVDHSFQTLGKSVMLSIKLGVLSIKLGVNRTFHVLQIASSSTLRISETMFRSYFSAEWQQTRL